MVPFLSMCSAGSNHEFSEPTDFSSRPPPKHLSRSVGAMSGLDERRAGRSEAGRGSNCSSCSCPTSLFGSLEPRRIGCGLEPRESCRSDPPDGTPSVSSSCGRLKETRLVRAGDTSELPVS